MILCCIDALITVLSVLLLLIGQPLASQGKQAATDLPPLAGSISVWGLHDGGASLCCVFTPSPTLVAAPRNATAIAAGSDFSVAATTDGTVWAWGVNDQGQLGRSSPSYARTPLRVPAVTDVVSVAAGATHVLALRSDGTVLAWGSDSRGQLGVSPSLSRVTPVQVSGLAHVVKIAAGGNVSMALESDGSVWTWGINDNGQLGDDTRTDSSVPVRVAGLSDVISIATDGDHALAVKSDGTVWAWGDNAAGELGEHSNELSKTPVEVQEPSGTFSGALQVAAGSGSSFAVRADGTVWEWGAYPGAGASGSSRPVRVGLTDVASLAAASGHVLALEHDGSLWGWGDDQEGVLGIGPRGRVCCAGTATPTRVTRIANALAIATSQYHSLAISSTRLPSPSAPRPGACVSAVHRGSAVLRGNGLGPLLSDPETGNVFVVNAGAYQPATGAYVCAATLTTLSGWTGRVLRTVMPYPAGHLNPILPPQIIDLELAMASGRMFTVNGPQDATGVPSTVSLIDARTGRLLTTLDPGVPALSIAVDSLAYRAYVTYPASRSATGVKVLAAYRGTVLRGFQVSQQATESVVDEVTHRLILLSSGSASTIDPATGRTVGKVSFTFGELSGAAVDPWTSRLFVVLAAGNPHDATIGSIEVIDTRTGKLVRKLEENSLTLSGPVFVDAPANRVLVGDLTNPAGGTIVLDARTGRMLRRLPWKLGPTAVGTDTGLLYLVSAPNTLRVIDPSSWRVLRTIRVGTTLTAIAFDEATGRLFVVDRGAKPGGPETVRIACRNPVCA